MSARLLVITDNARGDWAKRLQENSQDASCEIYVLTLGISPDYYIRQSRLRPAYRPEENGFKFVEIGGISEDVQRSVREFYINFIYELPRKVPRELFFHKGRYLWWFMDVTEKCPVRSRIIVRLFYLELSRRVIERDGFDKVYLDIDDYLLRDTLLEGPPAGPRYISLSAAGGFKTAFNESYLYFVIRYLKNSFGMAFLVMFRSVAFRISGIRSVKPPADGGVFFFTNYPLWWNNPFDGEKALEKFFGSIPEGLMAGGRVFYTALLFSLNPLKVFSRRAYLRDFFVRKNIFFLDGLLSIRSKLGILSFGYLKWALSVRRYFKESFKFSYGGFNIEKLFYYEMRYSLSHVEFFKDLLIEDIFKGLARNYAPKAILYRMEFQPFEKAILRGINRRAKAVALQHSTLSSNLISHSFAKGEISLYLSDKGADMVMPLPDIILTAGGYFRDNMIRAGFSPEDIRICGPVRYRGLIDYLTKDKDKDKIRKRLGFSSSEKIFLVVLNWIEEEIMGLISSIVNAVSVDAGSSAEDAVFILRSHPHRSYDKKIAAFLKSAAPDIRYFFLRDEFPLYDAVLISDGIIQVPTTLGYEAMAIGKMALVYVNKHLFNINSYEEFEKCLPVVFSSAELRDFIRSPDEYQRRNEDLITRWPGILNNYFYDLKDDPQKRFTGLLKEYGIFS